MVGITAYGAYIPIYRLSRAEIAKIWNGPPVPGEKAVANFDEDSVTMAVAACRDCIKDIDPKTIDSLYFASTRPPYAQKQSASIVSAACNLREDISSADFGHSLRVGTNALRAAIDAVKGGSSRKVIVTASECQVAPGDSQGELILGDGAAAFVIGDSHVAVSIEYAYSVTSDFLDVWRLPYDLYTQTWEDRFVNDMGYMRILREAILGLMKKYDLNFKDFSKVVYNAPDASCHKMMAKILELDGKNQVQNPLYDLIGNTGAASAMMILVSALEEAKAGDKILLANYGDGVDVFVLQVNDCIEEIKRCRGLKVWLGSKMMIPCYGKYLHLRDLMEWEVDRRPPQRTSLPIYSRERKGLIRLIGKRCKNCRHEQFPRMRICMWCQARIEKPEEYEDVWLVGQKGHVFSYSMDQRSLIVDLPNVNCVVDLEGGARFYGLMTDRDPGKLSVGMPTEFTFRKIHDGQGIHNYFWKVRPVRG